MTTTIATLRPTEAVTFDQGKLAALCDRMGPRAESFIAGVLADVETLIDAITRDHARPPTCHITALNWRITPTALA